MPDRSPAADATAPEGPLPPDLRARLARQPLTLPLGPSQISEEEARLLSWLAEHRVGERGVCVDAGCGTGGSSHALATGLVRNPRLGSPAHRLHCFDRFLFDHESYRGFLVPSLAEPEPGGSFLPHFLANMAAFLPLCLIHAGDLGGQVWDETPIALIFVDLAKTETLFRRTVALFYRRVMPGAGLVVHQDFERPNLHWIQTSTAYLLDEWPVAGPVIGSSLVLEARHPLPAHKIARLLADDFSLDERLALLDRLGAAVPAEGMGFDLGEHHRLTRAYLHARHGDPDTARRIAADCAARPYFARNRAYDWMIASVGRSVPAGRAA